MVLKAIEAVSPNNSLAATQGIITGMQGIGASSIVLQTYSSTVLAQPDIRLDILPSLPAQQAQARVNAQKWLNVTNPNVIKSIINVSNYANSFSAYANQMLPLAEKIDMGDKTDLPLFINGLKQLISQAQSKGVDADNLKSEVNIFQNSVGADIDSFNKAEKIIQTKITGDTGEIAQLRKTLEDLNSRMNADIVKISVGAVSDIVGVGLIVIGATSVIETGGATSTLIGAGITLVTGGTVAIAYASADIAEAQQAYGVALSKSVDLSLQVAAFDTVSHQITSNSAQASSAFNSAAMMVSGWQEMVDSYEETIKTLTNNQSGYLALSLMSAKKQWESLGDQARKIIQNGNLSFEKKSIAA